MFFTSSILSLQSARNHLLTRSGGPFGNLNTGVYGSPT